MTLASTVSTRHNSSITKEHLAQIWGIGLQTASQTLKVTTQKGIGTPYTPLLDGMQLNKLVSDITNYLLDMVIFTQILSSQTPNPREVTPWHKSL
jgi:hypothetical protein